MNACNDFDCRRSNYLVAGQLLGLSGLKQKNDEQLKLAIFTSSNYQALVVTMPMCFFFSCICVTLTASGSHTDQ
jgi:hypothetical protein